MDHILTVSRLTPAPASCIDLMLLPYRLYRLTLGKLQG